MVHAIRSEVVGGQVLHCPNADQAHGHVELGNDVLDDLANAILTV